MNPIAAVGLLVAAAILGGCSEGASQAPFTPSHAMSNAMRSAPFDQTARRLFAQTNRAGAPEFVHAAPERSWMSPDAKAQKALLYVSDVDHNAVYIYNYPGQSKLLGTLTYFEFPYGLCSDAAGDVFVPDFGRATVYEYAHAGTSPINVLHVTGSPIGCAVDATTGNLAVAAFNGATPSTAAGGVWVFRKAKGKPTLYQNPAFYYYWPPGYDDRGNLFIEGSSSTSVTGLAELPHASNAFTNISVNATFSFPAGVTWDGKYVAATDQGYQGKKETAIYQVSVSGSTGTVVNTILFAPAASCSELDIVQPVIERGARVIGGNLDCPSVSYWKYPTGGAPTATYLGPPYGFPTGQTISR